MQPKDYTKKGHDGIWAVGLSLMAINGSGPFVSVVNVMVITVLMLFLIVVLARNVRTIWETATTIFYCQPPPHTHTDILRQNMFYTLWLIMRTLICLS